MSELFDRILSNRAGALQRLTTHIPGFEGYLDNKARRTADRKLRDHVTDELNRRLNRLIDLEKSLLDGGGMSYMSKTSSAKTKLQLFRDRVKSAAPGYSGFFEEIPVTPEDMDKLYAFDEAQVSYADQFSEALNKLEEAIKAKTGIDEAIAALDKLAVEANDAFSLREDVITKLGKES
jgi:hypothetical protein